MYITMGAAVYGNFFYEFLGLSEAGWLYGGFLSCVHGQRTEQNQHVGLRTYSLLHFCRGWLHRSPVLGRPSNMTALALTLLLLAATACAAAALEASLSFDVLVYGATPGGVASAVAAAREGARVALAEPSLYIGGAMSGTYLDEIFLSTDQFCSGVPVVSGLLVNV